MAGRIRMPAAFRSTGEPELEHTSGGSWLCPLESVPVSFWEILFVVVVFALCATVNYVWLCGDSSPLPEHSGRSIQDSVVLWQRLCDGRGVRAGAYPPLAYLVAAAAYSTFGLSQIVAMSSQLVFLLPYLLGTWWVGRELGGRWGGVLACVAAAGNPWMAMLTHGFFLEISLTAMVACAFAVGISPSWAKKPLLGVLFGLFVGLGMLSKWGFVFFVAPVVIYHLVLAYSERGLSRVLAWFAILGLVVTAAALQLTTTLTSWTFPWKTYLLAVDTWCLLLGLSWWLSYKANTDAPLFAKWGLTRETRGWNAGLGAVCELALGFIISGWWYFQSLLELEAKAVGDFNQGYSESLSFFLLVGTALTCYWYAPAFFTLGTAWSIARRQGRVITLLAWLGTAAGLAFYVYSRVPPGPRYMLPCTVFILAVAFAWLGLIKYVRVGAIVVLTLVSTLQVGFFLLPLGFWDSFCTGLGNHGSLSAVIGVVPPPSQESIPVGKTVERIHEELNVTGESRITGVILPRGRLDVDSIMLESLLRGRLIDVEHYLPGRSRSQPKTALMLVIGDSAASFVEQVPELQECELLETWSAPKWGEWALYKHPTRIDDRPLPGSTDGPPMLR